MTKRWLPVEWCGRSWRLGAGRAVHAPWCATLIVADLHLGKADTFRAAGVPVPEGTTAADLARLAALLEGTAATRLIVLGDLLHAKQSLSPLVVEQVAAWRAARAVVEVVLVRGNHDRSAGDPPTSWGVQCVAEPWVEGGVGYCHDPCVDAAAACTLAGHVHPAVRLPDVGGHAPTVACFHVTPRVMTLPAFGAFTGRHVVAVGEDEHAYAVTPDGVIDVTALVRPRGRAAAGRRRPRGAGAGSRTPRTRR